MILSVETENSVWEFTSTQFRRRPSTGQRNEPSRRTTYDQWHDYKSVELADLYGFGKHFVIHTPDPEDQHGIHSGIILEKSMGAARQVVSGLN